jgi:hypothetical protein
MRTFPLGRLLKAWREVSGGGRGAGDVSMLRGKHRNVVGVRCLMRRKRWGGGFGNELLRGPGVGVLVFAELGVLVMVPGERVGVGKAMVERGWVRS